MCVNIIFSYPLLIYITNQIIEQYVFAKMRFSALRTWLKNLSRTVVLVAAILIGFFFYYSLHKILSWVGVVIGAFIVLVTPALVHNKVCATARYTRVTNILIAIYAGASAVALGTLIIYNWDGRLTGKMD